VVAGTNLIRSFSVSAIARSPFASNANACGVFNSADVAGPMSPEKPSAPLPAIV
jgi:hypothetical protein